MRPDDIRLDEAVGRIHSLDHLARLLRRPVDRRAFFEHLERHGRLLDDRIVVGILHAQSGEFHLLALDLHLVFVIGFGNRPDRRGRRRQLFAQLFELALGRLRGSAVVQLPCFQRPDLGRTALQRFRQRNPAEIFHLFLQLPLPVFNIKLQLLLIPAIVVVALHMLALLGILVILQENPGDGVGQLGGGLRIGGARADHKQIVPAFLAGNGRIVIHILKRDV